MSGSNPIELREEEGNGQVCNIGGRVVHRVDGAGIPGARGAAGAGVREADEPVPAGGGPEKLFRRDAGRARVHRSRIDVDLYARQGSEAVAGTGTALRPGGGGADGDTDVPDLPGGAAD